MAEVQMLESLNEDMTLWRYMSLDKLIDLINTKELFLTPLSYYEATDPYEGLMPITAAEAIMKEIEAIHLEPINHGRMKLEKIPREKQDEDAYNKALLQLIELEKETKKNVSDIYRQVSKSALVNCWHYNKNESEAMWKLYSTQNNGIAIKTTVGSLIKSINKDLLRGEVFLGRVKYFNFHDTELPVKECLADGCMIPLLKRDSFKHEDEVRLYMTEEINENNYNNFTPTPLRIKVDIDELIHNIYISPYSNEPYPSSVKYICEKFEIPEMKIEKSKLLDIDPRLLAIYSRQ
ncbi:DUF2971 domain-containing protein [Obesumbacterium proteus]|nr:DUF2971 domain-containing protein [Obesumbacterium proteus]